MIPAFFGVLGGVTLPILDLKLAPLGEPYSYVPPLVGIWMLIGVVIGLYFWFRERDKLQLGARGHGRDRRADADADALRRDRLTMPIPTTPSIHVRRDQNHLAWDPAIPPVATVGSGELVAFDCLDASNGQLTATSTTADLATLDFERVDQVTGRSRSTARSRATRSRSTSLDLEPADWGGRPPSRASGCWPTTSPTRSTR